MGEIDSQNPYRPLGRRLKELRTKANENLAEASGAVEIDVRELANYELGKTKPTEDVLLLLISHFGAKDDEAVRLWEMAGYGLERIPASHAANNEFLADQAPDSRVIFTDVVDITVNKYGVIMNFMQSGLPAPQAVARVGMSREHAKSILHILKATIQQTEKSQQKTSSDNNQTKQ